MGGAIKLLGVRRTQEVHRKLMRESWKAFKFADTPGESAFLATLRDV